MDEAGRRRAGARCRVITFSLADEPSAGAPFDAATGFDCYVEQVREAIDAAGSSAPPSAACSYGGLIAAAFAAQHPERVAALVLVSAMPPSWTPDARVRFYLRAPRLLLPLFCSRRCGCTARLPPHHGGWWRRRPAVAPSRVRGADAHSRARPHGAARRAHRGGGSSGRAWPRVQVPTLVVTGEAGLDRVVPAALTREYTRIWPHAQRGDARATGTSA